MSLSHRGYSAYQESTVQTASSEKLLVMLYDGLISALETAKMSLATNNNEKAHQQLLKGQRIIEELTVTLNMEVEISLQLKTLYDFFRERLIEANVSKTTQPIEDVLKQIKELREAWYNALLQLKTKSGLATN